MDKMHGAGPPESQVNVGRKYKSRKERPCDACRKRKICCTRDAYENACSLCKTRGESCTYVLPPNVRRNRQVSTARQSASTSASGSRPGTSGGNGTASSPRAFPSQANRQKILPSSVPESKPEWICQVVGMSGDQDPYVLRHCSFNHLNCYKAHNWAILRVKGDSELPLHFTVVPDTQLDARPNYYPITDTEAIVAPYANDLLRTYFEVVHVSYPLLDPSRFEKSLPNGDPLMAVMYNLANPFCQASPPFFEPPLNDFIQQALPIEQRHPRLETLEASLLHLHRTPAIQHSPVLPAWYPDVGALVGLTNDLGLNISPLSWSLSQADCNRRIRIWWGVYIADKWTALGAGRPSYLNDENSNVPLPTISNFSHTGLKGENIGIGPALQFITMAHLTTILSDILSTFYTLKSHDILRALPVSTIFSLLDTFQSRLHTFHETHLIPLYNIGSPQSSSGMGQVVLDSTGTTVLSFYTVQAVLYRAVLRVLDINNPSYQGVRDQAKTVLVSVVSFVEKLGLGRLRAFWWCPQSRVSFSLLGSFMFQQLLTSISPSDIEFWSHTIAHYRSILRLQSQTWEVTKLACIRMDLLATGMGMGMGNVEEVNGNGVNGQQLGGMGTDKFGNFNVNVNGGIMPGNAEEWIQRQGHEGMLLC
ncbi:hypothetical protein HYFRA_00000639 [Hymenoscyphus fraxineus]|uniref:Zn(2)-C6 fungal-type domain-containing protein n=1 Tax=Hymenoscyphus fraxineus TaxID=746836 RepID=A0A9N9L372_9HELO|nr:hypothetical protein HYFRA_00000639 [Hymenoscyphus fraxineus]